MLFSHKKKIRQHPPLYFNGTLVCRVEQHKHVGLILDTKLTFAEHINEKILKAYKIIGTLRYLSCYLPYSRPDLQNDDSSTPRLL